MNYPDKIKEKMNSLLKHSTPQENQQLYLQLCSFESYANIQGVMNSFFSEYSLFYIQTSDLYVNYKQHQYLILTENDLLHLILKHLSIFQMNTSLKQQTKGKITRKIKENSIYNVIPDSTTLQDVLSFLHPLLFSSKNGAKYFMTTLGDIIMKKPSLYYFLDPSMKPFIQKLQKIVSMYFCSNQLSPYKFKFCDHEPTLSRIIKTNVINVNYLKCEEHFYVNLICCSIHYSNRYNTSDLFLDDMTNQSLRQEVMWIKDTRTIDVIQEFIHTFFYSSESNLHEKDVLFLWKLFLKEKRYINIFQKNILEDLSKHLLYTTPYFLNISTMRMPYVKKFTHFWNKYMYEDKTEQFLELTEILSLFVETHQKYSDIDEPKIKEMLNYYYPDVIIENRYVNHVGCSLWNKKKDIQNFLDTHPLSHDLYRDYTEVTVHRKVSKQYFNHYTSLSI